MFWAVFDMFRLILLEAHMGQNKKIPDLRTLFYILIQNCDNGGSCMSPRWPSVRLRPKRLLTVLLQRAHDSRRGG